MSQKIPVELKKDINLEKDFNYPDYSQWKKEAEEFLKGASFDKKLKTKTYEGLTLEPLYTLNDANRGLSWPGFGNYRRGTDAAGYLKNTWGIAQRFTLLPGPDRINKIIKKELKSGLNMIHLDLNRLSEIELNLEYLNQLLKNIDLKRYLLMISAEYGSFEILSLFTIYLKENRIDPREITMILNADPIALLASSGQIPNNFDSVMDKCALSLKIAENLGSNSRIIGVNSTPFHSGGASIIQQSAYSISSALFFMDEMLKRDINIDRICQNINFNIQIGPSYFMEIANLRALRIVWSEIAHSYKADDESRKIYINASSSDYFQTRLDPYVNMLRNTTQAFSAVVGGVNNLETCRFSKTFSGRDNEDEFGRRQARNIQLILREESHLDKLIDPGAGSYYIEKLTEQLAEKILMEVKEIESSGGILENLKKGKLQKNIKIVAEQRIKDLNTGRRVVVGTNKFANPNEELVKVLNFKKTGKQVKLPAVDFQEGFKLLNESDKIDEILNLSAGLFSKGASLNQCLRALNNSDTTKVKKIENSRLTATFEEIRYAYNRYKQEKGGLKVLLANFGVLKEYRARADFSKAFFEIGGLEVIYPKAFKQVSKLIQDIERQEAGVVVFCSTDENYRDFVVDAARKIKQKNHDLQIILAGFPGEYRDEYHKAGVDDFIYLKADIPGILIKIFKNFGVL
jgi:methylmalonyl-CoA mutase